MICFKAFIGAVFWYYLLFFFSRAQCSPFRSTLNSCMYTFLLLLITNYWRKKSLIIKTSWLGRSGYLCPELCELMIQSWPLMMLSHRSLSCACPTCGFLEEQNTAGCENIVSTHCEVQLCIICLFVFKILLPSIQKQTWTGHHCVTWLTHRDTQTFKHHGTGVLLCLLLD